MGEEAHQEWTAPEGEGGKEEALRRLGNRALLVSLGGFVILAYWLIRQEPSAEERVSLLVNSLAALCTLGILTILYGENRVYRFFEHVFIGVATGYGVFITWRDVLEGDWWKPLAYEGKWYWIIPPLLALLYYTIYIPRYAWMSRFLISIMFGLAAGQAFQGFAAEMGPQITKSFKPLWGPDLSMAEVFNNWLFMFTLLCVMTYFFFSFRHRNRAVQGASTLGRWFLMIAFGSIFGSTVMARFSLFINRMQFLLFEWLQLHERLPWMR